jgi:hypothetical protein
MPSGPRLPRRAVPGPLMRSPLLSTAVGALALLHGFVLGGCEDDSGGSLPGAVVDAGEGEGEAGPTICTPGAVSCDGTGIIVCTPNGGEWRFQECPPDACCTGGACVTQECDPGEFKCLNDTVRRVCRVDCGGWEDIPCGAGELCKDGICEARVCSPGETSCKDIRTLERCNPNGTAWGEEECPARALCNSVGTCGASEAACRRLQCAPRSIRCAAEELPTEAEKCNSFGTCWEPLDCPDDEDVERICVEDECKPVICEPHSVTCAADDQETVAVCDSTGTIQELSRCPGEQVCIEGQCQPCLCRPGFSRCAGPNRVQVCNEDCSTWGSANCDDGDVCDDSGQCRRTLCQPPESLTCADEDTVQHCNSTGTEVDLFDCPEDLRCELGRCRPHVCEAEEERCLNLGAKEICNDTGTGWSFEACQPNHRCESNALDDAGTCRRRICQPGRTRCRIQGNVRETCSPGGTYWAPANCGQGFLCDGADCAPLICVPGERRCIGPITSGVCNDLGTRFDEDDRCDGQAVLESCRAGRCESACETAASLGSTEGCTFVIPDLPAAGVGDGPVLVAVANSSPVDARLIITAAEGVEVHRQDLRREESALIALDSAELDGSGVQPGAYTMTTTVPVFAWMLHGENSDGEAENMAGSFLPPAPLPDVGRPDRPGGWGRDYVVATWPASAQWHSLLAIVTGLRGSTVTVVPSVALAAGGDISATAANQPLQVHIAPYSVLYLQAEEAGTDLTGTRIQGTRDFMVYGAALASRAPFGDPGVCCDDAIAHHVPPLHAWGTHYVGARSQPRGDGEAPDAWRIVAGADGVAVTTDPDVGDADDLGIGEALDVESEGDLIVRATGQVLLLRVHTGSSDRGNGQGDPAVAVIAPPEQSGRRVTFHVPDHAETPHAFVDIIRQFGRVEIDGAQIDQGWQPIGPDFERVRRSVDPGFHKIESFRGRGLNATLYSWGDTTAWAVPLIFESRDITPPPEE